MGLVSMITKIFLYVVGFWALMLLCGILFIDEEELKCREKNEMLKTWEMHKELFYRAELDLRQLDGWWCCDSAVKSIDSLYDEDLLFLSIHPFMFTNGICKVLLNEEGHAGSGCISGSVDIYVDGISSKGGRIYDDFSFGRCTDCDFSKGRLWKYCVWVELDKSDGRYFSVVLYLGKDDTGLFLWRPVGVPNRYSMPQDGIFTFRKTKHIKPPLAPGSRQKEMNKKRMPFVVTRLRVERTREAHG